MSKPTSKQTWIGLAFTVLTFITGYLGVDKYQQSQIIVEAPEVNVAITSLPANAIRSDTDIKAMIKIMVDAKMEKHEYGGKFH